MKTTIPTLDESRSVRKNVSAAFAELPLEETLVPPERARLKGVAISVTTEMVATAAQLAESGDGTLGGVPIDPAALRALIAWDAEAAGVAALLAQCEQRIKDDVTTRWAEAAEAILEGYARLRQNENRKAGTTSMVVGQLRAQRPRRRRRAPADDGAPPPGGPKTLLVPVTVPET